MNWLKKGRIFNVDGSYDWMHSHASLPVCCKLDEDTLRIYYSTRDKLGRSLPSYIEVEADNPQKILYVHDKPILELGKVGTFDDNGIMISSIVDFEGKEYIYYIGWNPQVNVSYRVAIGLAIGDRKRNSFEKYSIAPIMDRSLEEPYFNTAPCVLRDGGIWRMWYASCTGWNMVSGKTEPVYLIRYAQSSDGIHWIRNEKACLTYEYEGEAIGRPWVIKDEDIYKMWYSTRGSLNYREAGGQTYRLGYAESKNGIDWTRKDDKVGIEFSHEGWDSEMMCYSSVYMYKNLYYLLYNGNGFGKSGFGIAIDEKKYNYL